MSNRTNYRKLALEHYKDRPFCAHCGFGIVAVLEVAHLDGRRQNNKISNLALLCPTCHKMHDLDLIPTTGLIALRDRPAIVRWAKRMKDAGKKAALSRMRRLTALRRKWRAAGLKAAATRRQNSRSAETRKTQRTRHQEAVGSARTHIKR